MNCPHDPKQYTGMPIGMYHCPLCGMMVVAGCEHTRKLTDEEWNDYFIESEKVE